MPTRRTTNLSRRLLAAVLLVAGSGIASRAAETIPDSAALLDAILTPPAIPYQGHMMVTQWYGRARNGEIRTRAEEMIVHVLPPDRVRREFLSPDGSVSRVSISDGDSERLNLLRAKKTVVGDAVGSIEKILTPEAEHEALVSNYELVASTGDKVAGHQTWKLTLKPKVAGKAWQTFWLDQETKIVLRTRRYQPHRAFASQAQFMSFEPRKPQDESLFALAESTAGTISAHGLAPEFLTLDELNAATGKPVHLPQRLPGGFIFESAGVLPVQSKGHFSTHKTSVSHARYTDGLIVLSVFVTDSPVSLSKGGAVAADGINLPGPLRASLGGKVLPWRVGPRHYTMMGDVPKELMAEIAQSLR